MSREKQPDKKAALLARLQPLIRKLTRVEMGARLGDEWAVKRFRRAGPVIVLAADNPEYEPVSVAPRQAGAMYRITQIIRRV